MKAFYDLHIHSALSPCGDEDMTPNNIVNMSLLKGLDVIAVTDHNSCGNVRTVMEVAGDRLLVIPGMEVETAEEVHILCYFPTLSQAEAMEELLKTNRLPIDNRPDIFGRQLYLNAEDEIIGEETRLLTAASTLSIEDVFSHAFALGGLPVPAHIDRQSYSVISNLGFLPPHLDIRGVEITAKNLDAWKTEYAQYPILCSSDAHYLGDIAEPFHFIDINSKNAEEFLAKLTKKIC
ncbi:MAG: PHP domain-containing protein [Clostridia bacterium]|nr:PHP domain-containing protein [Clostridia bacterium]